MIAPNNRKNNCGELMHSQNIHHNTDSNVNKVIKEKQTETNR